MPATGASGVMGIALEAVSGTFVAPTKFVPFESESLQYQQETIWRRPIRNAAGVVGAVPGNVHTEGDISMEALHDVVAMVLHASRATVVKTGAATPWTYVFTPSPAAVPTKTLSVAVKRNNEVFGYNGLIVSSYTFTIEDGILKFNFSLVGSDEATKSALTPTWPTSVPFGAGMYSIQIPTATQVFDTDNFEFQVEDNAEPQYRLRSGGARGAQFVAFGESSATMSIERDFETRADYDTYKALTAQSITLEAVNGAHSIKLLMPAAIKDSYEITIPGQGDLVRASVSYQGVLDSLGKHYEVTVVTTENIT